MRPRVFPAEDTLRVIVTVAGPTASMRPRVFPAEDRFMTDRIILLDQTLQ